MLTTSLTSDMHDSFFRDTATTEIYTLSLHDALPISRPLPAADEAGLPRTPWQDRTDRARARPVPRAARRHPHGGVVDRVRSEEHTSELQSQSNLVCRLLLEKKKNASASRSLVLLARV